MVATAANGCAALLAGTRRGVAHDVEQGLRLAGETRVQAACMRSFMGGRQRGWELLLLLVLLLATQASKTW